MKKIWLLIILLCSWGKCLALEYTDYSDYSDFTDEYIESNELTDVKTERRYKYYKLEKELGPYSENSTLEYPYIDKDDFIDNGFSALSPDKPLEADNRIIESVKGYHYRKVKDINYLELVCNGKNASINNFEVYYNGEKLDYEMEKTNDSDILKKKDKIILYFNQKINIQYLTLNFKWLSGTINESKFNLICGYDDEEYTFETLTYTGETDVLWKGMNASSYYNAWEDFYSSSKMAETSVLKRIEEVTLYHYKDLLYHLYRFNRIYYDEYLTEAYEDYIYQDETLYKDYYAKRVRSIVPEVQINELKSIRPVNNSKIMTPKPLNNPKIKSSKPLNNSKATLTCQDNSSSYQSYYPVKVKGNQETLKNKDLSLYLYFPWFLIFVILILVLSKLYKNKKECARV